MICSKCQFANPEQNQFCGMCGNRLQDSPAANPQEQSATDQTNGNSLRRPFIISTTAADATAHMLNSRVVVPSPSVASTTHTSYVPVFSPETEQTLRRSETIEPAPVDPHDEPFFSDASRVAARDTQRSIHEVEAEPAHNLEAQNRFEYDATQPEPSSYSSRSGSVLGLTYAAPEPVAETPVERTEAIPPVEHNSFLTFDDVEEVREGEGHGVSGPSFLGLGEPSSQDYLLEDQQRPSHARGYLVLFALALIAVLGFLEWRASNRGESMNPMDVLHVKVPKKKGQGAVTVDQTASNTPTSPAPGSAAGNTNGKPDLIAEPTQPAAKPSTPDTPPPASADAQKPPSDTTATSEDANDEAPGKSSASQNQNATAKPATPAIASQEPSTQTAKSTPPAASTPATPAPKTEAPKAVAKAAAPPPIAAKPTASKPAAAIKTPSPVEAESASLTAGSFELQKGIAAGSTEMGRMWLWKAMGKGNGEAPVLLADMYAQGKGVPRDCEQAMLLLRAAAKKANPRARSKLSSMYASGQCVPQDRVQAYKWISSALQVNPGSDWLEKNRESLLNQMTPAERQRASAYR